MKLVQFSTTRRVTVAMLMVAILAFGSEGFSRLAVNLLPDITYPTITVRTEYEGAATQEIERLLSEPIEKRASIASNVVNVSSISRPGVSDVIVQFAWGTNMDFASLEIREKLEITTGGFPPHDSSPSILLRFDPSLDPIMRVVLYGDVHLMELRRIAQEQLRPGLESLAGVAAVRIEGGLEEEIQVEVSTARLDYLGIPVDQVTRRLGEENVNLTGGVLKDGESEFLVRTLNEFETLDDIAQIVIGLIDRAPIKLADVGRVSRGHRDRDLVTRINGREGVEVAIFKEGDANTVTVSSDLRDRLDAFLEESPPLRHGGGMEIVFDQATFIQQAVDQVLETAIIGGFLAVLILFFFLRSLKSTLIIALSIPLSVITTFFVMFAFDISLNIMSLGGLALGIGMLVDNSIVVLESVQRCRDRGASAMEAARRGASEVSRAVVTATMTTICVFLPIVFVEGVAGQLFRDQALTVTYSLLASLLVAFTLIPMLSSMSVAGTTVSTSGQATSSGVAGMAASIRGMRAGTAAVCRLLSVPLLPAYWLFDLVFNALQRAYPRVLSWSFRHRLAVFGVAIVAAVVTLHHARSLGVELIPEMSQGEFVVDLEWKPGTPLEQTAARVADIDQKVARLSAVASVFSLVGTNAQVGGITGEKREHMAQLIVRLRQGTEEEAVMAQVRAALADEPELTHKFSRPSYFSHRAPVQVEVAGYSLPTLRLLAGDIAGRLTRIDGITDIRSSATVGQPEIQISLDRQRVAELGTTAQQIGELLRNKLQGEVATRLTRRDRRIDIRVRALEEERETLEDLKRMVVSPSSYPLPVELSSVAHVAAVEGPSEIRRVGQQRVALVSANLQGRDLGGAVLEIEHALRDIVLPEGFSITMGGQNEEMVRSFDSMKLALMLAVFLVYLVMASQFESLLHPLIIMFTIPLGLTGSAAALLATGTTISVVVLIGLVMLAGIVVNNAIVLVDYINHLRRDEGMEKMAAVARGAEVRFRPIMMTTSTTVLALLPMALGLGEGAEVRAPLAITVIGGLILSSALTLLFIPVVYASVDRGR